MKGANFMGYPAHGKALGVFAVKYAAKGIIQSPITAYSRRDRVIPQ